MRIKGKNIGKCIILSLFLILGIISLYNGYHVANKSNHYESGIVLGKNDILSSGKHPTQKFIIAFQFDNPQYGTQDINVTFHTWNSLKIGQRTAFHPNSNLHGIEVIWFFLYCVYGALILMIVLSGFGLIIYKIWNY